MCLGILVWTAFVSQLFGPDYSVSLSNSGSTQQVGAGFGWGHGRGQQERRVTRERRPLRLSLWLVIGRAWTMPELSACLHLERIFAAGSPSIEGCALL